jgi:hypothetical protein
MTSIKLLHVSAGGCHHRVVYWNKGIQVHYTARNDILRTLHLDDIPWDQTDRYRYLYRYTYCIQNIKCLESVLEVAHYHIALTSQLCTIMLFKFACSKVLIIQWYQWWRCVTQFGGLLDLCAFVLLESLRTAFRCGSIWDLDIFPQLYIWFLILVSAFGVAVL